MTSSINYEIRASKLISFLPHPTVAHTVTVFVSLAGVGQENGPTAEPTTLFVCKASDESPARETMECQDVKLRHIQPPPPPRLNFKDNVGRPQARVTDKSRRQKIKHEDD